MADIEDIDEAIANKIMNLLAMARDSRTNENEASNAMAAAQRLADSHNLSLANLDPSARYTASKKRKDAKFGGGLYQWQRDLYRAIAELNHCKHWVSEEYVPGKVSAYEKKTHGAEEAKYRLEQGYAYPAKEWRHRLLGSPVNVVSAQIMAEYLQDTVERLAREFVGGDAKKFFIKDAIAFREGVADRLVDRIRDQRRRDLEAQRKARDEAQARGDGSSLMILDDVSSAEEEANYDYQWGEGAWARLQASRAEADAKWAERRKAEEEAARLQEAWDAEHPEEAAERKAKQAADAAAYWEAEAKKAKRRKAPAIRYRNATDAEIRRSSSAFYEGSRTGEKVSLNKQVDQSTKGLLK